MTTWEQERAAFTAAAGWFADTAAAARGHEEAPGLGEWSGRDLLGHTSRSLTTVEQYRREGGGPVEVTSAAGYFSALAEAMRAPGVAQRGRDAGAALGPDPAASVAALAERVVAPVASWAPARRGPRLRAGCCWRPPAHADLRADRPHLRPRGRPRAAAGAAGRCSSGAALLLRCRSAPQVPPRTAPGGAQHRHEGSNAAPEVHVSTHGRPLHTPPAGHGGRDGPPEAVAREWSGRRGAGPPVRRGRRPWWSA